ncbi:hypothetical protein M427DRAFT_431373 [Gonapodya prolifera JEL478]|uniref:SH3 domain-containing protein n=1 Tax=Gonapodya prolifera (strain JEL478) TaxID=1344416 RepID=A0A139AT45_GONPJ|nr:hypothetical protein M427DRAFT_431373 [Gonapodya prolifera JEL478]|eukprot:KXS19854.1 hypothetical protein M427DRAFT_431373 [Gonapodya prolifera JEL478]
MEARQLISGIEAGDLGTIAQALQAGGPSITTTRKTVTLQVNLNGRVESDTVSAEPALLLAIRTASVDILRLLLDAGCDPNCRTEWMVAFPHAKWSQHDWEKLRWTTYTYSSPLEFALVRSPLYFNKSGAEIVITDPATAEDVSDFYNLSPSVQIVEMLLSAGARFGDAEMKRARELRDGRDRFGQQFPPNDIFLRLLKSRPGQFRPESNAMAKGGGSPGNVAGHQRARNGSTGSDDMMNGGGNQSLRQLHAQELARVAAKLTEQLRINDDLRNELQKRQPRSGSRDSGLSEGSGTIERYRQRISDLERDRQHLAIQAARVPELERERQHLSTQLAAKTVSAEQEKAKLERRALLAEESRGAVTAQAARVPELERENGRLLSRIAELEREKQHFISREGSTAQLEVEKRELIGRIADLDLARQTLQTDKMTGDARLAVEQSKVAQLERELSTERNNSNQLRQQIAAERLIVSQAQQKLSSEHTQWVQFAQEASADRNRLAELEQARMADRNQIALLEEKIITQRAQLERLSQVERDLAGERARAAALEKEARDAQGTISALKERISGSGGGGTTGRPLPLPPGIPTSAPRANATNGATPSSPTSLSDPAPRTKPIKKHMFVITPYTAQDVDELSLTVGEQVWVAYVFPDDWAQGVNSRSRSGVFPLVCLADSKDPPNHFPAISGRTSSIRNKNPPTTTTIGVPGNSIGGTTTSDYRPYGVRLGGALETRPLTSLEPHSQAISEVDSQTLPFGGNSVFGARLFGLSSPSS